MWGAPGNDGSSFRFLRPCSAAGSAREGCTSSCGVLGGAVRPVGCGRVDVVNIPATVRDWVNRAGRRQAARPPPVRPIQASRAGRSTLSRPRQWPHMARMRLTLRAEPGRLLAALRLPLGLTAGQPRMGRERSSSRQLAGVPGACTLALLSCRQAGRQLGDTWSSEASDPTGSSHPRGTAAVRRPD